MKIAHIFVDEYGTPDLEIEKSGVTPYFIYTGVVIENKSIDKAREVHKKIINNFFGGRHIKSRNINNDRKGYLKRLKIIGELKNFDHYVVALLVDKSKLDTDRLGYKKSFIKFFNYIFCRNFIDKYDEFHIYLDKTGNPSFQSSLNDYIENKINLRTLFSNNTFELKNDITEEPLIQIADFYSGCLGKYYCGKFEANQAESIHNLIKNHVFIDWFPSEFTNYFGAKSFNNINLDKTIYDIAKMTGKNYLDNTENEGVGPEIVRMLLYEASINPFRIISSKEIKQKIKAKGIKIGDPINEIALLRSKGVFIISPIGKKGYKFPSNEKEIAEFLDRLSNNVIPQIKRAHILHKILVEQSFGARNILKNSKYSLLSSLIDITISHRE